MAHDVFISYSRADGKIADEICKAFEGAGIGYWIDREGIISGDAFPAVIVNAISESKITVFISSVNSNKSKYAVKEVITAFNREKHIIPFRIDTEPYSQKLELHLCDLDHVEYWREKESAIQKLVKDVCRFLGKEKESAWEASEKKADAEGSIKRTEEEKSATDTRVIREIPIPIPIAADTREMREAEGRTAATESPASPKLQAPGDSKSQFGIEMVFVQGGTFMMGATPEQGNDCLEREKPVHQVTLSEYYIGKYEVTQGQWKEVMSGNLSRFTGDDNLPVENVSWDDVQEFIRKLNGKTGENYRLPTEAEWEYAARGGSQSRGYKYSGSNTLGDVAWYDNNSGNKTHPVGTKKANELGIYDMSGNVWEWVEDWYGEYSDNAQTNPAGPLMGSYRVNRGGSWDYVARNARVSFRNFSDPGSRYDSLGFRLARSSK